MGDPFLTLLRHWHNYPAYFMNTLCSMEILYNSILFSNFVLVYNCKQSVHEIYGVGDNATVHDTIDTDKRNNSDLT